MTNITHISFLLYNISLCYPGLLDLPICAVNDGGFLSNPRMSLRPATHGGEELPSLRWSYPLSGPRTAPAGPGGRTLPINSINYHPKYSNPQLQKHKVNWLDAAKHYRRFPLSMKERADPKFGMSEFYHCLVLWWLWTQWFWCWSLFHFNSNIMHNLIQQSKVHLWLCFKVIHVELFKLIRLC